MYDADSKRDGNFLTSADDARIPTGIRIRTLKSGSISYKRWFLPLTWGHLTIRQAYEYLTVVGAPQGKIPEVIRWTEGKDSHLVRQFFYGGVDLRAHDYVHILLGRGLLPKDEAFVIGFTMGTTNRLDSMNEEAFAYIAKHYYPNAYQMDDDSRRIFLDASKLGYISDCPPLDQVDFAPLLDLSVDEVRKRLNISAPLLQAYYAEVEQIRFPEDPASKRLLRPVDSQHDCWLMHVSEAGLDLEDALASADRALDASDQDCEIDPAIFENQLSRAHQNILNHLDEQRDLARECFEEINKVLLFENPHAKKDVETARWDDFHADACENVDKSRLLVEREVRHQSWEGYPDEKQELRTFIHALLGRGASPRDRAFCRGFFHGTSNKRTTYASQLKLDLMQEFVVSKDGLYSEDMVQTYQDGARLGYIADCPSLAEIDYDSLIGMTVPQARQTIGLKTALLQQYKTEVEDRRLLL